VVAEQPLDDGERVRRDVHGRLEGAVRVPVDRLEDGLARPHVEQVLGHDVEVVGVGVQRRDAVFRALPAVGAVVVVERDVRDPLLAEDALRARA
jgi:hypothetical protein